MFRFVTFSPKVVVSLAIFVVIAFSFSTANGEGYLTSVGSGDDKIPVVVVKGTPYEMGFAQGTLLKKQISTFLENFLSLCQKADPNRYSNNNLDTAWTSVAPYTDSRFKEELQGLSKGSGVPLQIIRRVHMMPVVSDYSCSSVAVWGKAAKNGHLYQTRNLDWAMHLQVQNHPCIVVYIPDKGIQHANITFAGFIGCNTGINADGIVLAEMGDSPEREYPFNLNGVHFTSMFRQILYDAHNLDEAVDIIRSAKRIKKYHYVIGDGRAKNAVKILAHAPEDIVVWKDNDPQDELAPNVLKDVVYQDEGRGAFKLLQKMYGKIDQYDMMDISRAIPIKGGNILNVVYDASALNIWVAFAEKTDEAYKRQFVLFPFREYLPPNDITLKIIK